MQFFSILTPKFANFCNFPPKKMLISTIFSKKKCNFGQFSTSETEKYEDIFSQFEFKSFEDEHQTLNFDQKMESNCFSCRIDLSIRGETEHSSQIIFNKINNYLNK